MIVGGYAGLLLLYLHVKTPTIDPLRTSKLDTFFVYCIINIIVCSVKWMMLSLFMCWITA